VKVLAIADSDSYVKWGASLLQRMPSDWSRDLVIIRTPALPSASQLDSALAATGYTRAIAPLADLEDLADIVAREQPDVLLLAVRGPVVRVLVRMVVATSARRPFIVSGMPGISIPATMLALYYRSQVDLLILHSKREVQQFRDLASSLGIVQHFALSTLPFLDTLLVPAGGSDIVFAAQAKVPKALEERQMLLRHLIDCARATPERRVILKLRGTTGEAQTHSERYPYDALLAEFDDPPENLVISTGPMSHHLQSASALVTVSSTAAIEAMAMKVPVLAIDDFGVDAALINTVFAGSGVLGNSRQLIEGDFRSPDQEWLDSNYFHDTSDETWLTSIVNGVARHRESPLPLRSQFRANLGGNLRRIWDRKRALGRYDTSLEGYLALAVGVPLRGAVRLLRRIRARIQPQSAAAASPSPQRDASTLSPGVHG
jgi:hypothetical protein